MNERCTCNVLLVRKYTAYRYLLCRVLLIRGALFILVRVNSTCNTNKNIS